MDTRLSPFPIYYISKCIITNILQIYICMYILQIYFQFIPFTIIYTCLRFRVLVHSFAKSRDSGCRCFLSSHNINRMCLCSTTVWHQVTTGSKMLSSIRNQMPYLKSLSFGFICRSWVRISVYNHCLVKACRISLRAITVPPLPSIFHSAQRQPLRNVKVLSPNHRTSCLPIQTKRRKSKFSLAFFLLSRHSLSSARWSFWVLSAFPISGIYTQALPITRTS